MAFNLRNRSFVKLLDFTPKEIKFLLDLSIDLKKAKYNGTEQQRLKGKNIALIFEKASTRTRCAFEVAAFDQGALVTYLGPSGSQIGGKESMKNMQHGNVVNCRWHEHSEEDLWCCQCWLRNAVEKVTESDLVQ